MTPRRKYTSNYNQDPINKKAKMDNGQLWITQAGSEEGAGNACAVRGSPSHVLLLTPTCSGFEFNFLW